ncbi:hypothetical protein [Duganella sp.]|uniref:helix-turn-helix domain-containing protein n=1 Tax=Duganella sp. TaxID=1904440 RepID=UPI0031E1C386
MEALVRLDGIENEEEYDQAVIVLEYLLDAGAAVEGHPLAAQLNVLSDALEVYEARHYPSKNVSAGAMLRFLMEQHALGPEAFRDLVSCETVASILNGSSQLTDEQVFALSQRFNVPVSAFR